LAQIKGKFDYRWQNNALQIHLEKVILDTMEKPGTGTLLIAEPFLKDPNFMRTVILLCDHQEEGSFGFVLNREFGSTLEELLPDITRLTIPVFYGGPVQTDTLHFLHSCPNVIPGGMELTDGIYWGGDFNTTIELLESGIIDEQLIRFFIGYSGWTGGQLDTELKEKSWLVTSGVQQLVFPSNMKELWKDSLRHLGGEYENMINFPTDPQLN
jgi:putative transcriptional regulator